MTDYRQAEVDILYENYNELVMKRDMLNRRIDDIRARLVELGVM